MCQLACRLAFQLHCQLTRGSAPGRCGVEDVGVRGPERAHLPTGELLQLKAPMDSPN